MAASCTYHLPTISSWLINKSQAKQSYFVTENAENVTEKGLENGPLAEKGQYNKNKRTKQKNKEVIGKRNQMTALRF